LDTMSLTRLNSHILNTIQQSQIFPGPEMIDYNDKQLNTSWV
jgi:hypothetical protein